ncbi:hypothetical protein PoB_003842400 [Plakobranchus ocellatus]|uniref:Uncharacterized protein n=1 Tax=Plakobranchus ocellatus TaxID=259542 RepID=A0AAV4AZU3_9GAST|nr:hypothetical protein PoB_003842400 [Plakobranchus ocellatus]
MNNENRARWILQVEAVQTFEVNEKNRSLREYFLLRVVSSHLHALLYRWASVGVGGSVTSEFALRSAGTLLSRARFPPSAPGLAEGLKSLRSPCCGQAIYKDFTPLLCRDIIL